jgi:CHAT domain-containing protein/tetratricopeptide (TPR) repeat protein
MSAQGLWCLLVTLALPTLLAVEARQPGPAPAAGVVVETVAVGSSARQAGIQPGDAIVAWTADESLRASTSPLRSSFEITDLEIQQAPKRQLFLKGSRSGVAIDWTLQPGILGLTVRPVMPTELLDLYTAGDTLVKAKQTTQGTERWRQAADRSSELGDTVLSTWFVTRAGTALTDARQWEAADTAFADALARAEHVNSGTILADIHRQQGRSYQIRQAWSQATASYERALEADRLLAAESLAVALDAALLGGIAWRTDKLEEAETWFARALKLREALAPGSIAIADSLADFAGLADDRGNLQDFERYQKSALEIILRVAPDSLRMGSAYHDLGILRHNQGDLKGAEELYRKGLAIREAAAPDSIWVSISLNSLGLAARERGDLDEAEQFLSRALTIQEREAPGGFAVAQSLNNLGIVMSDKGDLGAAEQDHRRALEIRERLSANSIDVAASLNNVGLILKARGDLEAAEAMHLRALEIRQRLAPEALVVAASYNNLGAIAYDRGDLAMAGDYYQKSLSIRQRLAPKSIAMASSLNNLAHNALDKGDIAAAEDYLRRGLRVLQEVAPTSVPRINAQVLLASAAVQRNDLPTARTESMRAVEIAEGIAPSSTQTAGALHSLAEVLVKSRDLDGAQGYLSRSLNILTALGSPTMFEADGWHLQGEIYRRRGQMRSAYDAFSKSVDIFERLTTTVGGARDVRSAFQTKGIKFYGAALEAAISLGRPTDAFALLERSRARSLLNMMAERDLLFSADLSAEVARELRQNDIAYDNVVSKLSSLRSDQKADAEPLVARLRQLRDSREQLMSRVRQLSPRLADLRYPVPLNLEQVRAALDPGTLMLSYWIGEERSFLFAVQPSGSGATATGLSIYPIDVGEKALRVAVKELRVALQPRSADEPATRAVGGITGGGRSSVVTFERRAGRLYDLLVKPVEAQIGASERLLLVPDGPLHALPFAVLRASRNSLHAAGYLIEWKPLHIVASATVYSHTRRTRATLDAQPVKAELVAFGDPAFTSPSDNTGSPASRRSLDDFTRRGFQLTPLPGARREVRAIVALFGDDASAYLGPDATEERAKTIEQRTKYIHFASHALLDERLPLNSALVLATPWRGSESRDNGLLQVWEIFEGVRLDAELVTLSACETALGEEFGGEGLMGLTRAFQFAGARSVVASLWSIADNSTEALMVRFYRLLREGRSKDEALRTAQVAAIRSKSQYSHPFHWAAFQIFGDWR